jgi:DNA-binding transcriptional ArsR family regulator
MPREVERQYDAQLAKALSHPLRARILERLERQTASPSDLATGLAAPLGNVSYHVRILADAGLIELVRTTRRRGATQHHYRAVTAVTPASPGELSDQTPPARGERVAPEQVTVTRRSAAQGARGDDRSGLAQDSLRETVEEIRDRVRATGADPVSGAAAHVTRTPLVLDELGWEELLGAVERLHDLALRLQLESAPRLRRVQHENEREANLVLMLFESSDPAATRVLRGGVGERRRSGDGP